MKSRIILGLIVLLVSLQAAHAQSSFGRTAGKFGVSAIGSAQYSIPIWTPPGPKGMQPNLAILYDSGSGVGPLGIGWSLAGLGSITRCNKTYAQDSVPPVVGLLLPVALVTSDGYCLNGNRLRLYSGTYGAAGSTYQTEIADFSLITANGTQGNGPASFSVQGRDGNIYQYGLTDTNGNGANSQVLAGGAGSTALTWLLSKVIDRAGNNYVINYVLQTGTAVPDAILWTPISAGASTYTYKMQFNYTSNVPQSSLYKYVGGALVNDTKLLSSIAISNAGTVIKDYFFTYQASASTTRSELVSIKECADSAQSNCLLPTAITYQAGSPGVSTTATTAVSASISAPRYDLNGDGIPDLIYGNSSGTFVAFGSSSGYGTPVSIPNSFLFIGNLTGGDRDGLLTVVNGIFWYYTWNDTSRTFVGFSTGIAFDSTATQYQIADVDGDGLPDLISMYITGPNLRGKYTATVYTQHNTSSGGTPSFSATLNTAYTSPGTILAAQFLTPDMQWGKIRRFDFNGDGRDDIVVQLTTGNSPNFTISTYELLSTGTTFTPSLIQSVAAAAYPTMLFANWNDDACTDVVTADVFRLGTLYISGCNGSTPSSYSVGTVLAALDWDGDGRTDLVVQNGSTLGVYLSTGAGVSTLQTTTIPYISTCQYITMDANGDGLDDLGCWSQTSPYPLTYYLHNGAGQPPDLASSFQDGYGVTYAPSYVPLTASGGVYTSPKSPIQLGPMYLVSSSTSSDGIGGTFAINYSYAGATLDLQGRGFQGFTTVTSTDSRTGLKDTRTYSTVFPNSGMLTADSVTQSDGTHVSVGSSTPASLTLDSTANNQRFFPYTASSTVDRYEVQIGGSYNGQKITTTATTLGTPDIYGNFSNVSTTVTDQDSGSPYHGQQWTSTTATTITPNPNTWCNSLPTEQDVTNTAPGVSAITRHVGYLLPDYVNCRETEQVVEAGTAFQVDTKYAYLDSFGNMTGQTVTGSGMAARTNSITWSTTGQFPTQVTNALSQVSFPSYDSVTGKLLSFKDPNGITSSWHYDPFGRLDKQTFADGTSTSWAYNSCATAGCVNGNNVMTVVASGDTLSNTYLDRLDRVLVTSKPSVSGTYNRIETQYDNLGNVHLQGMPCTFVGCVQYWTSFAYDVLNRLVETAHPVNASSGQTYCNPSTVPPVSGCQGTAYSYQGRTTITTDAQGKTVTTVNLVTGAPGRTKDHNGYYVNFNHDAFGSVLSVTDSLSNTLRSTTAYDYGVGAFPRNLTDMDLGTRTYHFDALGELTSYSDGKGQSFSTIYDALSRPTSRTEPDVTGNFTTTWSWGTTATSHNIGHLASVSSSSTAGTYSEAYTYDTHGRVSNRQFTIPNFPNLGTLAFDYAYNPTNGFLSSITFPTSYPSTFRLQASLLYQYGVPYVIEDAANPSTVWWRNKGMNPRGQITGEDTMDLPSHLAIKTGHAYDAVTGWLSSNSAGPGTGNPLQNEAYQYDKVGNVIQRQNNNLGLTENYYYDNLYRLDHSTLGGATNLQMAYDAMGDITSRSDVAAGATWTYDPIRKHAVTQAGSSAFSYAYDANGNVSSRNGSIIGWTSYNYPNGVTTAAESATFDYGPDRQRWRMTYNGASGTERTYYATPTFEAVATSSGTDYRHYIYAMGRPVLAISRTTAGAINVRSLLADLQGSISTIAANATGTAYATESFTPFGNRREASTWSGAPTSGERSTMDGVTRQGYTFQTVLGSMGLNHMNARIEDAVTGRFLSPDTGGTIAGSTQSWNRYSYANNNPVSFIDPTGHNPYKHCTDFCPGPGFRSRGDPGSLSPSDVSGGTSTGAGFSFNNSGTGTTNGDGYLSFTVDGTTTITPNDNGGGDAAAGNAAASGLGGYCGACDGVRGSNTFNDPHAFDLNTGVGAATPPPSGYSSVPFADLAGDEARGQIAAGQYGLAHPTLLVGLIATGLLGPLGLELALGEELSVFRVFGGDARGMGRYWTTVNPTSISNYRNAAGLFPANSGGFIAEGTVTELEGVAIRTAAPGPGGIGGGLPEVFVPNPATQICITCIYGVNPPL